MSEGQSGLILELLNGIKEDIHTLERLIGYGLRKDLVRAGDHEDTMARLIIESITSETKEDRKSFDFIDCAEAIFDRPTKSVQERELVNEAIRKVGLDEIMSLGANEMVNVALECGCDKP